MKEVKAPKTKPRMCANCKRLHQTAERLNEIAKIKHKQTEDIRKEFMAYKEGVQDANVKHSVAMTTIVLLSLLAVIVAQIAKIV